MAWRLAAQPVSGVASSAASSGVAMKLAAVNRGKRGEEFHVGLQVCE